MSGGMAPLPLGWTRASIDELCQFNPKHDRDTPSDLPVSFVPMAAVSEVSGRIETPEIREFGEVKSGFTQFANGDVIWAKITPCMENGKSAVAKSLTNGLGCGSTEFMVLRSYGAVESDYLHRFMRQESYRKAARKTMQSGVGQARVPKDFVLDTQIPLPPLNEQKRIVARTHALHARSNAAKEALDAIPPLLEKFRQSVLAAAFRGDLTKAWRQANPDVEPATELLARIRAERRRRWEEANPRKKYVEPEPVDTDGLPELPEGWCWATLDEIVQNHDGTRIPVKRTDRADRQGKYPYYGASGIIDTVDDYLFDGEFLLIAEDGANLLARSTPIAFQAQGKFWVNNHAHVVQTIGELPLDYLEYFLNSISLRPFVTGSAQPKLTQKAMNSIPVPMAPSREARTIVRDIRRRIELAANIDGSQGAATSIHATLNQSILAKAFRGELVPQDPTDEPASVLLERIRGERAAGEGGAGGGKGVRRGRKGMEVDG
jgi:type I restriction enzyme S subunit